MYKFVCRVCCDDSDPEPCVFVATDVMYKVGSDPELCPLTINNIANWVFEEEFDDGR